MERKQAYAIKNCRLQSDKEFGVLVRDILHQEGINPVFDAKLHAVKGYKALLKLTADVLQGLKDISSPKREVQRET